jgi:zinc ribbon protein
MDNSAATYLVIWVISGLIGLAINKAKGKSLAWGFVGGLVFGLFGWIFLALHGTASVPCNACKQRVAIGATICRHCGTKFALPAGSAA